MYCKTCEADVAAEVSADGKSLLCTTCGNEVRKSYAPSLSDEAKSARELLERWSNDSGEDPFETPQLPSADGPKDQDQPNDPPAIPPAKKPGAIQRTDVSETLSGPKIRRRRGAPPPQRDQLDGASGDLMERPPRSGDRQRPSQFVNHDDEAPEQPQRPVVDPPRAETPRSEKKFRIDAAHTRTVEVGNDGPNVPPPHQRPAPSMPDGHRLDARHEIPSPHMRTESFIPPGGKRPGRVESVAGQLLAYGGVGLLTVGTALILWGYFGGPVRYAPTGWLVATVGQMILLLGVVTLISGGMQQTTHEVGMRVADLGTRLGRIEETTELALNSPHFLSHEQKAGQKAASRTDRNGGASFE